MAVGSGFPRFIQKNAFLPSPNPQQVGMTVFALVRHEEFDIQRLQGRLIERQRTLNI
jgi:hypothetical protein